MGRWLQQILDDALLVHWETDEGFRHRRLPNRANKASTRSSKYTGSSVTFMKTKARLLDRKETLAKTFKYTRILHTETKGQTQQSQQNGENATDGSATSVIDPNTMWHETASAPYKNCVYGLGSFFTSCICTSTLRPSLDLPPV
ncbi:hypothetical protein Ahy_A01g002532 [Arachis hypogaea]|uniref:Uncharacterized protein n=1 Tax=Arachis hypogaea TaxID=3818 RepID=A0A445EQV6_ARAHY|nr:hypothetical protein Ahy_A01g002532 [Arachis hypogaea]